MEIVMSGYKRVNYYELCRLCTSSEGSKIHIFREEGKRRQLSTKIQMCFPLQVTEEDSLPKIICNNCLDKLENFFDFRNSCVNAEALLEGYFTSLRYNNNDFNKEGKVYIKDVALSKSDEIEDVRLEVNDGQLPTREIHVQLPEPSQVKVSQPHQHTVTSVPVTLDSLSSLVQAATIQIVGQNETEKLLDSRLQQYKCSLQIQQPNQSVESSSNDNRYQTTFQSPITSTTVLKSVQSTQTFIDDKSTKSDSQQERAEEESSEDRDLPIVSEASLQPTIAFSSTGTGQDVLVHFGFNNKEKETVSPTAVFRADDSIHRNSVVQIGEFLRMKTVGMEESLGEEGLGSFSCENCGKEVSEEEKNSHACEGSLGTSEDKPNHTYLCDICSKPFKRKEHLFQHKKLHTGERPFLCGRCGKAFSRKEHLVRHSVSHTGQKQYSCDICGKSFGRKDNVRKHRKTHGLSGPFVCETCGKTFVVKPYYLMHKASHCSPPSPGGSPGGGESFPYRCDVCNKGFTVKHYLTTHKLRHRNKAGSGRSEGAVLAAEASRDQGEQAPLSAAAVVPPNVLHQGQVGQLYQVQATTPTTYICTATNQLLETYRKLNTA